MLGWAAAYVVLVAAAFVVVLARREPTVVRGDYVFLLTALYVLVAAGVTTIRGGRLSLGVLAVSVVVLLLSPLVKRWMHLDTLRDDDVGDDLLGQEEAGLEAQEAGVHPQTQG